PAAISIFAVLTSGTAAVAPFKAGLNIFSSGRAGGFARLSMTFAVAAFFFSTLAGGAPFFAVARSAWVFDFTAGFARGRLGFAVFAATRLFAAVFFVTSDSVSYALQMSANFVVQSLQFIPVVACPALKV